MIVLALLMIDVIGFLLRSSDCNKLSHTACGYDKCISISADSVIVVPKSPGVHNMTIPSSNGSAY